MKMIPVVESFRFSRSTRNSCPIFPVQISSRVTPCSSVSGSTLRKRGLVKSANGETASGCRSMLFGVNTISGLRHVRIA
jgi:hypothetical protein